MCNQLFVPNFLFDFYTLWGLSALLLPLLIWAGPNLENFVLNRQSAVFAFFQYLIAFYIKSRKAKEIIFGSLVVGLAFYWYSSKHVFTRYISPTGALQMCRSYFGEETYKRASFSIPQSHIESPTAIKFTILLDMSGVLTYSPFSSP